MVQPYGGKIFNGEAAKLYAPPETVHPTIGVREDIRKARETKVPLTGFGVLTAEETKVLTIMGFPIAYFSGWRHASSQGVPDISVYPSHDAVTWALATPYAINMTRHYFYHHNGKNLKSPYLLVDIEAGMGGTNQTWNLAYKLASLTNAAILHLENQHPADKVCGHDVWAKVQGQTKKEPKLVIPRKQWLSKLAAAQEAVEVGARDSYKPGTPYILARTDSADGILEDGTHLTLNDAIDDIVAAHEQVGIKIAWAEFNNSGIDDPLRLAEQVFKRAPGLEGLFFNVSPNQYKNQHPVRSKQLAEAGYIGQFSTTPLSVITQREVLRFSDDFKKEPFEAVLEMYEEVRKQGMLDREDGFWKGQTWVGADWWRELARHVTGPFE